MIETEQLEYWADKFVEHNLSRYLPFAAFITNPKRYWDSIMGGEYRPLTRDQLAVKSRIDRACHGLENAIARLERQVEHLCRTDNGRVMERLKHTTARRCS